MDRCIDYFRIASAQGGGLRNGELLSSMRVKVLLLLVVVLRLLLLLVMQ